METRKKISLALTGSVIITYGALGFVGALQFSKIIFVCGTAFVFSGFVEGQVYWEKIAEAINSFFDGNYLQRSILRKKLQNLINDKSFNDNLFINEYRRTCQYLIQLYRHKGPLSTEQKQEVEDLSERIKNMENFLLKWLRKPENNAPISEMERSIVTFINANANKFDDIDQIASNKKPALYIGGALCIGAGIGSYFATLGAINMGLALFGISLAGGPFGVVFAIVLFGAAGYALSLYQSISEIVKKYTLDELYHKVCDFFVKASWAKRVAMALVIGLTIFCVLATAGTWLKLINNGASLVPIINKLASVIEFFSIIVMAVPSFIYSLVNSCESFNKIDKKWSGPKKWEKIKKNWQEFCGQVKNTWEKENFIQFINPFRPLTYVLEGLIFLAHLSSMAVGNDQFPEKFSSTIAGITVEGMVDAPALFSTNSEAEGATVTTNDEIDLDELEDKHNNHSEFFADALLFIPRSLGALWDWALGSLWFYLVTAPLQKAGCFPNTVSPPNWQAARDKYFEKPAPTANQAAFRSSDTWVAQELMEHCDQHISTYGKDNRDEKLAAKIYTIDKMKGKLAQAQTLSSKKERPADYQSPDQILENTLENNKGQLAIHRDYLFSPFRTTKSMEFMNKMNKKYSYQR